MSEQNNPLAQYFRQTKKYITIPSKTSYYDESTIVFTDNGEVGIKAMTSADELILKNPDALLNGEAVKSVLVSCVDNLLEPANLLTNDVDVLLVAIRQASYGDPDVVSACPKCEHDNTYSVPLDAMVSNAKSLDSEYEVNLDKGATVFVRPFTYSSTVKAALKGFEQSKAVESLSNDNVSDMEKLKLFSKSFKELSKLNYELLTESIVKVVDEAKGLDFTNTKKNHKYVTELLKNIDISEAKIIDEKIKEINNIGIDNTLTVTCDKCKHTWETELELNPVSFFTGSSLTAPPKTL